MFTTTHCRSTKEHTFLLVVAENRSVCEYHVAAGSAVSTALRPPAAGDSAASNSVAFPSLSALVDHLLLWDNVLDPGVRLHTPRLPGWQWFSTHMYCIVFA